VTIKAWGPAWVLAGNVQSGKVLTAADAVQDEVDWAAESAAVLANQESWVGQVASRQLLAGQALRQSMVRPPELFRQVPRCAWWRRVRVMSSRLRGRP